MEKKEKRSFPKWWLIPIALAIVIVIVFFSYVSFYYRADETAESAMRSDDAVRVVKTDYGYLFDGPSEEEALIFYPGGKVETTAYAPLLHSLAAAGLDVCLAEMPFRLAVFGGNRAEKAIRMHGYSKYYIGGHSLGGAMAANYAASHGDEIAGVILLAAYPTKKLPDGMIEILLVGSEDQVVNRAKIESGRAFAPSRYIEKEIEGGNHAFFGNYGAQKGDGAATLTPAEQQALTVREILEAIR